ncbi:hypothetical protein ACFL6L_02390 [candidate division KSB1 bacterium]
MAAPLSQEEIDALLTDNAIDDDDTSAEETEVHAEPASGDSRSRNKHFGASRPKPFRYHFRYKSPILKSREILLNPGPDSASDQSGVIVRNLNNYAQYRKTVSG